MAATDTVIVDIPALEEAISSFRQCSNIIGDCVSSLQSNSSEIRSAWTSNAADIYQVKMQNLAKNVGNAQSALQMKIQDLTTLCEKSKAAEKTAQGIADSVESNFMV